MTMGFASTAYADDQCYSPMSHNASNFESNSSNDCGQCSSFDLGFTPPLRCSPPTPGCLQSGSFTTALPRLSSQLNHLISTNPSSCCTPLQQKYCPQTQPSYCPQTQPSYCVQTQPSFCPKTQPSYCPPTQPSYCPPTQPSYCPQTQPSYCPQTQPSHCPQTQTSYCSQTQPSCCPQTKPSCCPQTKPSYCSQLFQKSNNLSSFCGQSTGLKKFNCPGYCPVNALPQRCDISNQKLIDAANLVINHKKQCCQCNLQIPAVRIEAPCYCPDCPKKRSSLPPQPEPCHAPGDNCFCGPCKKPPDETPEKTPPAPPPTENRTISTQYSVHILSGPEPERNVPNAPTAQNGNCVENCNCGQIAQQACLVCGCPIFPNQILLNPALITPASCISAQGPPQPRPLCFPPQPCLEPSGMCPNCQALDYANLRQQISRRCPRLSFPNVCPLNGPQDFASECCNTDKCRSQNGFISLCTCPVITKTVFPECGMNYCDQFIRSTCSIPCSSIKDMEYVRQLTELCVMIGNQVRRQIRELEHKEQSYKKLMEDVQEMVKMEEEDSFGIYDTRARLQQCKMNIMLQDDNWRLENDLDETKMDLQEVMDKIEEAKDLLQCKTQQVLAITEEEDSML